MRSGGYSTAVRGYVLLPVVLLLTLVAAVAFMTNNESALEVRATGAVGEGAGAVFVARAGLQHSLQQIAAAGCGPYSNLVDEPFDSNSYSTNIEANEVGGLVTTYLVPVSGDAYIRKDFASQNYGSDTHLATYSNLFQTDVRRALYQFDIANAGIPADAIIMSATVRLFVLDSNASASVNVHRITSDWDEATVTWSSINASYDAQELTSISAGTPQNQYVNINLAALVQGWVSGSVANQGIMLRTSTILDLAEFSSKENSNADQRPFLVVKVTDGSLSTRANITATGAIASGARHTLERKEVTLYQPASTLTLQPDASGGRDGQLYASQPALNYGVSPLMSLSESGGARPLLQFNLDGLPPDVRIDGARLELYVKNLASAGSATVHRVTTAWTEGSCNGAGCTADGATWNTTDGVTGWTTAGGDYETAPYASAAVASTGSWVSWDVGALVRGWTDGSIANHGLLLLPTDGINADLASSDEADAALHPRLLITLACECGTVCQLPQGNGRVLLVVDNALALTAAESKKKALFEAWGYSVKLISDNASQNGFDSDLASHDVVYVSESVNDSDLVDKLADTARAVISEEPGQLDNLGMASAGSETVTDRIEVTDNTHYITALFPPALIPISRAPMEGLIVNGTPAGGLQVLGLLNGASSLVFVEEGGVLAGGGTAPGRRVMIPVGRADKFNWDYLNNNGRLIVQRAIQWGVDSVPVVPPKKVYWTDDVANMIQRSDEDGSNVEDVITGLSRPTGLDIDTVHDKLYWTNNYQIMRANLDGTNSEVIYSGLYVTFDIKLDVAGGKMYWTHDNGSSRVMSANLDGSGATLINNSLVSPSYITLDTAGGYIYLTEFGSGRVSRMKVNGTGVTTLTTGPTGPIGNALDLVDGKIYWTGGASNDWIKRADLNGANVQTIVTGLNAPQDIEYDADNNRIYWVDALNRRVQRSNPDGSNVETIVSSGLTRPRAIVLVDADQVPPTGGGGGGSGDPPSDPNGCSGTFRDEFNAEVYSGNDGTLSWTGDWIEINESDGPTLNDERVFADLYENPPMPTFQLHVRDNDGGGEGVMRALDLSGASTATLTFDYKPALLDDSNDYASVQMSTAGVGGPWSEVARFSGPANETAYQPFSADISAYISANAVLRIITSPNMGPSDYVFFDNIQIECVP